MPSSCALSAPAQSLPSAAHVLMSSQLFDRVIREVTTVHAAGLKSFGLLVADPAAPQFPYCATEAVFFDSTKNRRNDPTIRPAFEAQGRYFRSFDDAGFVADPIEVLHVHRSLEARGLEPVAMFHTRRRQPANFSVRDTHRPVLGAFEIRKDLDDFGIDASDINEHSERAYTGPEVAALAIHTASAAA
jgi:hypothetical protein